MYIRVLLEKLSIAYSVVEPATHGTDLTHVNSRVTLLPTKAGRPKNPEPVLNQSFPDLFGIQTKSRDT